MTTLYEGAFAKINLTLDVLGKRADGYHDLQSVMQTISIRDDVEIDVGTGKPWRLLCSVEGIPTDEKNLAWKAAKVYCDAMGKDPEGLEIRIVKRIPAGAGLGGGSADAAAVLRALNRHYGDPLSVLALAELGRTGWQRRSVLRRGRHGHGGRRGERLRKLPDMPDCLFVVCKRTSPCPRQSCMGKSTPWRFPIARTIRPWKAHCWPEIWGRWRRTYTTSLTRWSRRSIWS